MSAMRRRVRWVAVLLVVMLLPVGHLAGFTIQRVGAQNAELLVLDEWSLNEYGDGAWFDWNVLYEDGPYELFVRLYRLPNLQPVQEANVYLMQDNSWAHVEVELAPGTYKIVLELAADEQVIAQDEQVFTLSGVPMNIYLFGADSDTLVKLTHMWTEYDIPLTSAEQGNGFMRYTFEIYPNTCYLISSPTYPGFVSETACAYGDYDYVYHLLQPDFTVELEDYKVSVHNNAVSGHISFYGWESSYRLIFVNQYGDEVAACREDIELEYGNESGVRVDFDCDLPASADSLRIDAVADGFSFPTNLVLSLDDIGLPGQITVVDRDQDVDEIELMVQFTDSPNVSEIALYRVRSTESNSARYFVAGEGQYDFTLPRGYSAPGDMLMIEMIGTDGHVFAKYAFKPIVDDISGMVGGINFACENRHGVSTSIYQDPTYTDYYCERVTPIGDNPYHPDDAKLMNGQIQWTLPDTGELELIAYDLLYADDEGEIIRGEARFNWPAMNESGTFAYVPTNAPQNATHIAVVTLLIEWAEEDGYEYVIYYFSPPFFIPLAEQQPPTLAQLKVNGFDAQPDADNPNHYIAEVEWDAEEAQITATSTDGIVKIGETPLEPDTPYSVALEDAETPVTITVHAIDDEALYSTYVLTIVKQQQQTPDELVEGSDFNKLDDGSYGYVPKGMTAGELMDKFRVVSGAETMVKIGEDVLSPHDPVMPGAILIVTHGEQRQEVGLRFLAELLRTSGTETITIVHVVMYVIGQLSAETRVDLTGDGEFGPEDVRALLGELDS